MMQTTITCPSGQTIRVEVACTAAERRRGLSGRYGLLPGTGMLLAFHKPGIYGITMQAVAFPLDIIWIAGNHAVVDLGINAPAGSFGYRPSRAASYVLETPAGDIYRLGLKLGDVLRF